MGIANGWTSSVDSDWPEVVSNITENDQSSDIRLGFSVGNRDWTGDMKIRRRVTELRLGYDFRT